MMDVFYAVAISVLMVYNLINMFRINKLETRIERTISRENSLQRLDTIPKREGIKMQDIATRKFLFLKAITEASKKYSVQISHVMMYDGPFLVDLVWVGKRLSHKQIETMHYVIDEDSRQLIFLLLCPSCGKFSDCMGTISGETEITCTECNSVA